jgi:hypothetical protein
MPVGTGRLVGSKTIRLEEGSSLVARLQIGLFMGQA